MVVGAFHIRNNCGLDGLCSEANALRSDDAGLIPGGHIFFAVCLLL